MEMHFIHTNLMVLVLAFFIASFLENSIGIITIWEHNEKNATSCSYQGNRLHWLQARLGLHEQQVGDEKSKMLDEKYRIYEGFCERPIYWMEKQSSITKFFT